jgi:hypothetical protein
MAQSVLIGRALYNARGLDDARDVRVSIKKIDRRDSEVR